MARIPVPINPQTQVTRPQPAFRRGAQVDGNQLISAAVGNFSDFLRRERARKEEFDISKELADEKLRRQLDFDNRADNAEAGAPNFVENLLQDMNDQHIGLLQSYRDRGYSESAINALDLGLTGVRGGFVAQAINFRGTAEFSKLGADAESFARTNSKLFYTEPESAIEGIKDFERQIRQAPVPEFQQQDILDRTIPMMRMSAARGRAENDPVNTLRLLDPGALFEEGISSYGGYQGVAAAVANWAGLTPEEVAGVFSLESSFDPDRFGGADGTYLGLIQFNRDNQRKYGIKPGSTPEEWSKAIIQYMKDQGYKPGTGLLDFYSTILAGKPGLYDRRDKNGSVREHVENIRKQHLEKGKAWLEQGAHARAVPTPAALPEAVIPGNLPTEVRHMVENPDGTFSTVRTISIGTDQGEVVIPTVVDGKVLSDDEAIARFHETGENFGTFKTPEEANDFARMLHEQHARTIGQTGDPVLDMLTPDELAQTRAWALQRLNENRSDFETAFDLDHKAAVEAGSRGETYTGPDYTPEDYAERYGPVIGPAKYAERITAEKVGKSQAEFLTMSPQAIQARVDSLRPTDTGDPSYPIRVTAYEAAQSAQRSILEQREKDPAAFALSAFSNVGAAFRNVDTPEGRKAYYSALANAYERMKVPESQRLAFPKEVVDALRVSYEGMNGEQKLAQLEEWWDELQPTGLYVPLMIEMNRRGFGPGYDNFLRFHLNNHPEYRAVMLDVLRGRDIIKDDPARIPSMKLMNTTFAGKNNGIGTAIDFLNQDSSRIFNQAATAIYVANGGRTDGGLLTDAELYTDAVRRVFGGTSGDDDTGFVYFHSGSVKGIARGAGRSVSLPPTILPPGVSGTEFEDWLETRTLQDIIRLSPLGEAPEDASGNKVTGKDLTEDGVFVMLAPGRYTILSTADGRPFLTPNGNPFVVNITPRTVKGR